MGQSNDKIAIKHYKTITQANTILSVPTKEFKEQVLLSIKLENADALQYQYTAYQLINNKLERLVTSEESAPLNNEVSFQKTFFTKYHFEKEQPLKIIIKKKDHNDSEIECNVTLGSIIGSKDNILKFPINNSIDNEIIVIKVTELKDNQKYVNFNFEIQHDNNIQFTKNKFRFNYVIKHGLDLYQSETISRQGTFNASHIPMSLLDSNFNIEFINYKNKCIKSIDIELNEFLNKNGKFQTITLPIHKKKQIQLINKSEIKQSFSFIDYLKSGVQIGMSIAIDFTRSNGLPSDPQSLHYISQGQMNQYENVIYSCGKIISHYNHEQKFTVYGFGANLQGQNIQSMSFPINGNSNDPSIHTIDNVIEQYHQIVHTLDFSGPTYFGPVLKETIKNINKEREINNLKYTILMILTDGIINDMNECIDLLIKADKLPLSVIIIGIGNSDFSQMEELNMENNTLISNDGERCCRDLIQFVTFEKYKGNGMKLAETVLEAIPKQIITYYSMNNVFPN